MRGAPLEQVRRTERRRCGHRFFKGIARRAEVPDLARRGPSLAEEGSFLLRKAEREMRTVKSIKMLSLKLRSPQRSNYFLHGGELLALLLPLHNSKSKSKKLLPKSLLFPPSQPGAVTLVTGERQESVVMRCESVRTIRAAGTSIIYYLSLY